MGEEITQLIIEKAKQTFLLNGGTIKTSDPLIASSMQYVKGNSTRYDTNDHIYNEFENLNLNFNKGV